jgi:phosphonoacetaldehyde hydrolase
MDFVFRRTYRGPLKAVILDWAGTTVDYGCFAPAGVFVEVFKRQQVEITMAEARAPMGIHKRDHIRVVSQMPRVATTWQQVHNRPCTEADIETMFQAFIPLQLEVISSHAELIPEVRLAQATFQRRHLKIGTTTGYNNEMMDILTQAAKRQGYSPDHLVCATDVPNARPAPWMALLSAMHLNAYPLAACVKIGDTPADIEEGLNAGMWSVGVVLSSNEMGLTLQEVERGNKEDIARRKAHAEERLLRAGAHYVIDTLAEVDDLLDEIEARLHRGDQP